MPNQWYSIIDDPSLEQGDILLDCPLYSIPYTHPLAEGGTVPVDIHTTDLIVVSQSCDLVEGREKVDSIVLCAIHTVEAAKNTPGHVLATRNNREHLLKYGLVGLHPLKEFENGQLSRPISFISFGQISALPIHYVRDFARSKGSRLRLNTPFREHMAQRFAYFFGRIGLPEVLTLTS